MEIMTIFSILNAIHVNFFMNFILYALKMKSGVQNVEKKKYYQQTKKIAWLKRRLAVNFSHINFLNYYGYVRVKGSSAESVG